MEGKLLFSLIGLTAVFGAIFTIPRLLKIRLSDHAVSYIIAALIGVTVAVILGYIVYAQPGQAVSFGYWLSRPFRYSVHLWAFLGGGLGIGARYLLESKARQ